MAEAHDSVEQLADRLRESIRRSERSRGLDWRFNHSAVRPAGARELVVEVTGEEVYADLIAELGGGAQRIGRAETALIDSSTGLQVRLELLSEPPERLLWVTTSVADIRREPAHAAELINQLIMGEWAHPLKREGEWSLARLPDGYLGWIHSWSFTEVERKAVLSYEGRVNARVAARVGYVLSEPRTDAVPLSEAVAGTALVAARGDGTFREVLLPSAKKGLMPAVDLESLPILPTTRTRLLERALRFIGIPYLWGGTSAKAFDCSGFVKRVFQLEGVGLPRDSDLQARIGAEITVDRLEEVQIGDLLFFGEGDVVRHVAIYAGRGRFIHAYGQVRMSSLCAGEEGYEDKLARSLLFGRSVIGAQT